MPKREPVFGVEVRIRVRGQEQEERGQGGRAARGGSSARFWGFVLDSAHWEDTSQE